MNESITPPRQRRWRMLRRRPPGPRGFGIEAHRAIRHDPLAYFDSLPRRYGELIRIPLGPVRYFSVADPSLIEQVLIQDAHHHQKGISLNRARVLVGNGLLVSEGDLHRREARLIAPALSPRRVEAYQQTMRTLAEDAACSWRDGAEVDVAVEMTRLTLRIVTATLFRATITMREADAIGSALTSVLQHIEWFVTHPLGALRARIPTRRVRDFRAARGVIDAAVARLITARAAHPPDDDLLSNLAAQHACNGDAAAVQLRDELVTLLVSGHETTANWLAFTWHALAENPHVEARLHAELDQQLGDRPVTLADTERLPYLRAVLDESLRLYPPVWAIERRPIENVALAGYDIPAGSVLSLCQFSMHRDARFWEAPDRFDPDRWLDPRAAAIRRGVFFPFADGPRRCIAEHFARAEAVTVLATIARQWRLRPTLSEPMLLTAKITLRPRGGLRMIPHARAASELGASTSDRRAA